MPSHGARGRSTGKNPRLTARKAGALAVAGLSDTDGGKRRSSSGAEKSGAEATPTKKKKIDPVKVPSASENESSDSESSSDTESSSEESESKCDECEKPLKNLSLWKKSVKRCKPCGKRRSSVERMLSVGKHTKSKKGLQELRALKCTDKDAYQSLMNKLSIGTKKGARVTRDQITLLKTGLDKVKRVRKLRQVSGYIFLTRKEFGPYAEQRWKDDDDEASKRWSEYKRAKGALSDTNEKGKFTLGIPKPKELNDEDAIEMAREKSAAAGKLQKSTIEGLAAGFGGSVKGKKHVLTKIANQKSDKASDHDDSDSDEWDKGSDSDSEDSDHTTLYTKHQDKADDEESSSDVEQVAEAKRQSKKDTGHIMC